MREGSSRFNRAIRKRVELARSDNFQKEINEATPRWNSSGCARTRVDDISV